MQAPGVEREDVDRQRRRRDRVGQHHVFGAQADGERGVEMRDRSPRRSTFAQRFRVLGEIGLDGGAGVMPMRSVRRSAGGREPWSTPERRQRCVPRALVGVGE